MNQFSHTKEMVCFAKVWEGLAHTHHERSGQITGQVAHQAVCTVQGHSGETSQKGRGRTAQKEFYQLLARFTSKSTADFQAEVFLFTC